MLDQIEIPDNDWYMRKGAERGLGTRCPFASIRTCPRYYQSLSLLGEAGTTSIPKSEDKRLLRYWQKDDLWPQTGEQATSVANKKQFHNFCPEVSFDSFGYFASSMGRYVDELDSGNAHSHLAASGVPRNDPRWAWAYVAPQHFTECPLYAPLHERSKSTKKWISVRIEMLLREHPFVSSLIVVAVILLAIMQYFGKLSQAIAQIISLLTS